MNTATIDPEVAENTTPVTPVEESLVGTPQPITAEEDQVFEALLAEEQAAVETPLVDQNIYEMHENEQLADPVESYEDPIINRPIEADEPIAGILPAVGEIMDLPAEPAPATETIPPPEPTKVELLAMLERLKQELASIRGSESGRRQVASGSKARPNVLYTLLNKPNSWHSTPQVAQLQGLLFDPSVAQKYAKDGVVTLTEPELFGIIEDGKAAGKLRTKQPAVRIFQYYRNELLLSNTLRWQ